MKVPLTVNDFINRAELLYPDRTGIVDEPDQPAESWGSLTYRDVAERARAIAAGLDEMGIGQGERVAMVSHNSARLITALFGVSGSGRILVPVNFRLVAEEVRYIVEHSGSEPAARRSGARRGVVERDVRPPAGDRQGRRRGAAAVRGRARAVGRRRGRHGDDQLHVRARPPGRRACSSPTATSGSTPRRSAGTWA